MKMINIYDRDPNHANRLFDVNGIEYSHPLGMDIPELPFKAIVNINRRIITDIVESESEIVFLQPTMNIEELVML